MRGISKTFLGDVNWIRVSVTYGIPNYQTVIKLSRNVLSQDLRFEELKKLNADHVQKKLICCLEVNSHILYDVYTFRNDEFTL